MRYLTFLLLVFLAQVQLSAQQDDVQQLEQRLSDSQDVDYFTTALQLSDAHFKAGRFDKAAHFAAKAFNKAKDLKRKDLMALALNKEAKAIIGDQQVAKTEKLAALGKFGESLELCAASKHSDPELEKDNIKHLKEIGAYIARTAEKGEVQKLLNVCLDSVKKELTTLQEVKVFYGPPPQHPSPPSPPDQPESDKRKEKQREFQHRILELKLAEIEKELRGTRTANVPPGTPPLPEFDALALFPDLKERWLPQKEELEKEFAREVTKIERMNADEAKEELLLAEYKYKYDSLAYLHTLDSIHLEKKELALRQLVLETEREKARKSLMMMGSGSTLALSFLLLFGLLGQKRTNRLLSRKNEEIQHEQTRSENLLLNILPAPVAQELKLKGAAKAHRYDEATVLFSDFQNFTGITEEVSPEKLISDLDHCFKAFDRITEKYRLEKIKTIGDAYLCVGGLPTSDPEHATRTVQAALEMQQFLENWKAEKMANGEKYFEARIGIHTGPVIAGVVGMKKFAFDIWGDTVNIASRMESSGEVGRVNISGSTWERVKYGFQCTHRGKIEAKNKGCIDMYFVEGNAHNTAI